MLRQAPTCDKAKELFGDCAYGASGDISLGQIVTEKCEGTFLQKLSAAQRRTYDREMKRCGDKYKNMDGPRIVQWRRAAASIWRRATRISSARRVRVNN